MCESDKPFNARKVWRYLHLSVYNLFFFGGGLSWIACLFLPFGNQVYVSGEPRKFPKIIHMPEKKQANQDLCLYQTVSYCN